VFAIFFRRLYGNRAKGGKALLNNVERDYHKPIDYANLRDCLKFKFIVIAVPFASAVLYAREMILSSGKVEKTIKTRLMGSLRELYLASSPQIPVTRSDIV
jgi:hypothetical protein